VCNLVPPGGAVRPGLLAIRGGHVAVLLVKPLFPIISHKVIIVAATAKLVGSFAAAVFPAAFLQVPCAAEPAGQGMLEWQLSPTTLCNAFVSGQVEWSPTLY
jgi:hypothetical protein